jgi:hypothetical protein
MHVVQIQLARLKSLADTITVTKIRGALRTLEILGRAPLLCATLAHANSHQLQEPTVWMAEKQGGIQIRGAEVYASLCNESSDGTNLEMKGERAESSALGHSSCGRCPHPDIVTILCTTISKIVERR